MPDVLIRDIAASDLELLEAQAKRAGLSCDDFLRHTLTKQAQKQAQPVTVADLQKFSELCADLADEEVMAAAWK